MDVEEKYRHCMSEMDRFIQQGDVRKGLEMAEAAQKLKPTDKLGRKIGRMKEYLNNNPESDDEEDNMVQMGEDFYLYGELYNKLYPYQREAVLWLWKLFKARKGGILGDDMGLGKTIQIIAFLSGMFDLEKIQHVLIVMPLSLIENWKKEFNKWAPGIFLLDFMGPKPQRQRNLARVQKKTGVLVTTYGLMASNYEILSENNRRTFVWDYVILDEGHKIKNPTKTTKALHNIPARNRIILTGTPLQNNLREMWSLFDFAHQGTLLGTSKTFRHEYENPITRAREKDATIGEKRLGLAVSESLQKIIAPYFLRRTKEQVLERGTTNSPRQIPALVRKNDFIIWLYLSDVQLKVYTDFLKSDEVKQILMTKQSPLVQLTVLKKICDHPRLLSERACRKLGLDKSLCEDEEFEIGQDSFNERDDDEKSYAMRIDHVSDQTLIKESGKLGFLIELVSNLCQEGHKCLIFSQSCKMLNIIQRLLTNRQIKWLRIDGSIISRERNHRVELFQTTVEYSVFLLTTQTGGVGLTLTNADRVIIYDPSWNPAVDAQAVDRVYRIGQNRPVIVYRLITCSTVEEKIYRRQVFKDSINRQTTGDSANPFRYFSKQELRELFLLDNPKYSTTQKQLEKLHSSSRKTDEMLDKHVAFLQSLDIFGISDHDLMFTKAEHEETEGDVVSNDFYQSRVNQIENRVRTEAQMIDQLNKAGNTFQYRFAKQDPASRPREFLGDLTESTLNTSLASLKLHEKVSRTISVAGDGIRKGINNGTSNQENVYNVDDEDEDLPQIDWNRTPKPDSHHDDIMMQDTSFNLFEEIEEDTSYGSKHDPICIKDTPNSTPVGSPLRNDDIILVEESDVEQDSNNSIPSNVTKEKVEDSFENLRTQNGSFPNTERGLNNVDDEPAQNVFVSSTPEEIINNNDKDRRRSRRSVASSYFKEIGPANMIDEDEQGSPEKPVVIYSSDSSEDDETEISDGDSDDEENNKLEASAMSERNEAKSYEISSNITDDDSDSEESFVVKRVMKRKKPIVSESDSDVSES